MPGEVHQKDLTRKNTPRKRRVFVCDSITSPVGRVALPPPNGLDVCLYHYDPSLRGRRPWQSRGKPHGSFCFWIGICPAWSAGSVTPPYKKAPVGATLGRPWILLWQNPSPQGENTVILLRKIRKTTFFGGRSMIAPTSSKNMVSRQSEGPLQMQRSPYFISQSP